ncbi:MAG: hypothetical protein V1911_03155 [Candidatus Micrarchaeota archaeon]
MVKRPRQTRLNLTFETKAEEKQAAEKKAEEKQAAPAETVEKVRTEAENNAAFRKAYQEIKNHANAVNNTRRVAQKVAAEEALAAEKRNHYRPAMRGKILSSSAGQELKAAGELDAVVEKMLREGDPHYLLYDRDGFAQALKKCVEK